MTSQTPGTDWRTLLCGKPRRYFSQQTCELPRGHAGEHEDATHIWENDTAPTPPGNGGAS